MAAVHNNDSHPRAAFRFLFHSRFWGRVPPRGVRELRDKVPGDFEALLFRPQRMVLRCLPCVFALPPDLAAAQRTYCLTLKATGVVLSRPFRPYHGDCSKISNLHPSCTERFIQRHKKRPKSRKKSVIITIEVQDGRKCEIRTVGCATGVRG